MTSSFAEHVKSKGDATLSLPSADFADNYCGGSFPANLAHVSNMMDEPRRDCPQRHPDEELKPINRYAVSIFFIVAGSVYFLGSAYLLIRFIAGETGFLDAVRSLGFWSFAYFLFYIFVGFFVAVFYVAHLIHRRPSQVNASILGIGVALMLTATLAQLVWLLLNPPSLPWE